MDNILYDGGNDAVSTLKYDIGDSDTDLYCQLGDGDRFPSPSAGEFFYLTIENVAGTLREVVKVTARSNNDMTVVRAQDDTAAQVWPSNSTLEMRLNDGFFDYFVQRSSLSTTSQTDKVPQLDSDGKLDYDMLPLTENMETMGAYGIRWDPINDTFLELGGSESPVHDAVDGAVLKDFDASINYYLNRNDFRRKKTPATTGTADGTTSNHLIDSSTNFSSSSLAQIGDYVYNSSDDTFAKVTAVADGDLSLDADIFVSGGNYELGANLTGVDGQVMVQYPKCYVGKFERNGYYYFLVSDVPVPGLTIHDAFYVGATGDNPREYRYAGKYQAVLYNDSDSAYINTAGDHSDILGDSSGESIDTANDYIGSIEGYTPLSDETRDEFRSLASNLGSGDFWQEDYLLVELRQIMYLTHPEIRSASNPFDSQTNVPGHTEEGGWDYSKVKASGLTNYLGVANGSYNDGDLNVANNINGLENFFGSIWEWKDGININDWLVYLCSDPTNFTDDTTTNYTQLEDQYGDMVKLPGSNDYQKYIWAATLLPFSVGGSSSTYICDYFWQNSGWRVVKLGGSLYYGSKAGFACLGVGDDSSNDNASIGSRLAA